MRTDRAFKHIFSILLAFLLTLAAAACDEPPERAPDQIDIDAESKALDESVDEARKKADERVASPAEPETQSDKEDDAPAE